MKPDYNNKREFLRYSCSKPVKFRILFSPGQDGPLIKRVGGVSKNLSASGILFNSDHLPEISSILELELDYRTTGICQEIEGNALVVGNKLLGKVVRIEENEDGNYNIGVAFIKKSEHLPPEIEKFIK